MSNLVNQFERIVELSPGLPPEIAQLAKSIQPDVVLMDVQMPRLDGIEATRCIKQCWPAIKVIVLTMYTTYQTAAMAAGADVFLLKGGSTDGLLTAVFS